MFGLICPNDGEVMESDAFGVNQRKPAHHTCPLCGYSETR